jgi:hypothetical protein
VTPRAARIPVGVALGILTAVVEVLFLLVAALAVAGAAGVPPARRRVRTAIRRYASALAGLERGRLARFHGVEVPPGAPGWRSACSRAGCWPSAWCSRRSCCGPWSGVTSA